MKFINSKLLSACVVAAMLAVPGFAMAKSPSRAVVAKAGMVRSLQYQPGVSYVYQWDSSVNGQTNSEGKDGLGSALSQNELHSRVRIRVVEPRDGSNLMEARLEDPHLLYQDERGSLVEARDEQLLAQLQLPVYFEQFKDGSIGQLLASKEDSSTSLNLKRALVSANQTSLEGTDKPERDVSGSYKAHYKVADQDSQLVISRDRNQDDFDKFADPTIDDRKNFALSDHTEAVFDQKSGTIVSSSVTASVLSSTNDRYGDEGYSIWSTAESNGKMSSLGTEKDPYDKPDLSAYQSVDSIGQITPDETLPPDGEKPALARAESDLALLQQTPDNPTVFNRFAENLRRSPTAVEKLGVQLRQGLIQPAARGSIINALAAAGTPAAQQIIIDQLRQGGDASDAALIALAFVAKPTPEAVDAVELIFANTSSPQHTQATLVLGALADKLQRAQPFRAAVIAQRLEKSLRAARDTNLVELYLNGLGNAGATASLESVTPFLSHESPEIRIAAVDALRKHPVAAVSGLIQARFILDQEPAVRDAALATLRDMASVQRNMVPLTLYSWSWSWWLGGHDLGANLTASASADTGVPSNIILRAQGEAVGWAFNHSYSLVSANAYSDVVTQSGVLKRHFTGNVKVLGNTLVNLDKYVTCGSSQSGNLYSTTRQFFSLSYTFYLAGVLPITLSLSASGSISVPYDYRWNACNVPVYMSASAQITPTAWVSATGGVTVSIWIARGGASITADLLRTGVPSIAEAHINSGVAGACITVSLSEQAVSGGVDLWYQLRGFWGWGSRHSWRVWSFSSPTHYYPLYNHCWP